MRDHQDRLRDHLRSGAGVGVGMLLKGKNIVIMMVIFWKIHKSKNRFNSII